MKKISLLVTILTLLVAFTFAQQATTATNVPVAQKVMKADAKTSEIKSTPAATNAPSCSHGAAKTCTGEAKPACCQKPGAAACTSHTETEPAKKPQ